jgi:hypothetical protein
VTLDKSELAETLDRLQAKLRAFLKDQEFRARGRTFNRKTSDGLIQVVQIQMGGSIRRGRPTFRAFDRTSMEKSRST